MKKQKYFILFILIYSSIALFICFFFLEFWYAKREGLENGFHIGNTSYSINYWFSHVSYLTAIIVVIWSALEFRSIYFNKKGPKFVFKYFVLLWSFVLLISCGITIPFNSSMQDRMSVLFHPFNCTNWWGLYGFIFSLLDFFQFSTIHLFMPIILIIYSTIYNQDKEIDDGDLRSFLIWSNVYIVSWWLITGIETTLSMGAPYLIIDWSGDPDSLMIWIQVVIDLTALLILNCSSYLVLNKMQNNQYEKDLIQA